MTRREYQVLLPLNPADLAKLERWIKAELAQGRKVATYGDKHILRAVSLPKGAPEPEDGGCAICDNPDCYRIHPTHDSFFDFMAVPCGDDQ